MQDESTDNLGTINPFRYRSYYFDKETGWYYLNSRYYNPQLGRFVTMDEVEYLGASGSLLGYNLYSYCENNPVMRIDENGNVWWIIVPIIIGLLGSTSCKEKDYSNYYGAA